VNEKAKRKRDFKSEGKERREEGKEISRKKRR